MDIRMDITKSFISLLVSAAIALALPAAVIAGEEDPAPEFGPAEMVLCDTGSLPMKMTTISEHEWNIHYPSELGVSCYSDADYKFVSFSEGSVHGIDYYGLCGDNCAIIQSANEDSAEGSPCKVSGHKIATWTALEFTQSAEIYVLSPITEDETDIRYMNWLAERGFEKVYDNGSHAMARVGNINQYLYKRELYVPDGETITVCLGYLGVYTNNMYSAIVKFIDLPDPPEKTAWVRNANQLNWAVINNTSITDSFRPWHDNFNVYSKGLNSYDFSSVALIQTGRYEPANEPFKTIYKANTTGTVETVRVNYPCEVYVAMMIEARNECGKWLLDQGYEKCPTVISESGRQEQFILYKKTFATEYGELNDIPLGTVNSNWFNQMCSFIIKWLEPYSGEIAIEPTLSYEYDSATSDISVKAGISVSMEAKMAGTELDIAIYAPEKDDPVSEKTSEVGPFGGLYESFTLDYLPGVYTVTVDSPKIAAPASATFEISDMADYLILLDELENGALTDETQLKEILEDENKKIGADLGLYRTLSDDLKKEIARKVLNGLKTYTPEAFESALKDAEEKAVLASKDASALRSLFELREKDLGIQSEDFYEDYKALSASDTLFGYLAGEAYADKAALMTRLRDAVALQTVKSASNKSVVTDMLEKYPDLFNIDTSAADYKKYRSFVSGYIFERLSSVSTPDDVKSLAQSGIEAAKAQYAQNTGSGASGGSSGGGGGGSSSGSKRSGVSSYQVSPDLSSKTDNDKDFEETVSFTDLPKDHWAYEAVVYHALKGVIAGSGDGSFRPSDNITRAEFIKIITVAFGYDFTSPEKFFEDVGETDWFYPYVSAGYKKGIISGTGNGFSPNSKIKRQDAFLIIKNALGISGEPEAPFADEDDISDYAKEATGALAANKIIKGFSDNTVKPKSFITRAEAAQLVFNALKGVS